MPDMHHGFSSTRSKLVCHHNRMRQTQRAYADVSNTAQRPHSALNRIRDASHHAVFPGYCSLRPFSTGSDAGDAQSHLAFPAARPDVRAPARNPTHDTSHEPSSEVRGALI